MDKILVIDDELVNRMMVKRILEQDYEIYTSSSGEEGLALLEEVCPSLILLDIHMTGIDGYETLSLIRSNEKFKEVPIIFLSADDDSNSEVKGFEVGADDFIKKPFVSAVVKRRVERCLDSYHLHRQLQEEVEKQTQTAEQRKQQFENLSYEIIQSLTATIDAKDIYTKGHSKRVSEYSAILAKALNWTQKQIEELRFKALLHDIGKIGVPDRILNKNGRLSSEEFEIIKTHTTIGSDILKGVSSLSGMYLVARSHHERYDGKGYPDRLAGKEIPIEARLVGIADAYDAMSSDRVYRKALSPDIIRNELINGKGTQFDPDMLDVFIELFDNGKLHLEAFESEEISQSIDIRSALEKLFFSEVQSGATQFMKADLSKVLPYLDSIGKRYKLEFTTIIITLGSEKNLEPSDYVQPMQAMEYSISQSLRKSDMFSRLSATQFILVLVEAHSANIQQIVERIFSGFFGNCLNVDIKPAYEIHNPEVNTPQQ